MKDQAGELTGDVSRGSNGTWEPREKDGLHSPFKWRREIRLAARDLERTVREAALSTVESRTAEALTTELGNSIGSDVRRARECVFDDEGAPLRRWWKRFVAVWTGSEAEAAWECLHAASANLLMVIPVGMVQDSAVRLHTRLQETPTLKAADPKRYSFYLSCLERAMGAKPSDVSTEDRKQLRSIQNEMDREWATARDKVRIFRNVVTSAIGFLLLVLLLIGFLALGAPSWIPLRYAHMTLGSDVFTVEMLGALGGLVSGVAALQRLSEFEQNYGLPLAQSLLKIPMGAATALIGILLLQHGLLSTAVKPQSDWATVLAYAALFGFAQLALTWAVDSKAQGLLQDAGGKSPTVTVDRSSGSGRQ